MDNIEKMKKMIKMKKIKLTNSNLIHNSVNNILNKNNSIQLTQTNKNVMINFVF